MSLITSFCRNNIVYSEVIVRVNMENNFMTVGRSLPDSVEKGKSFVTTLMRRPDKEGIW